MPARSQCPLCAVVLTGAGSSPCCGLQERCHGHAGKARSPGASLCPPLQPRAAERWHTGTAELRHTGTVERRHTGTAELRHTGTVAASPTFFFFFLFFGGLWGGSGWEDQLVNVDVG